MFFRNNKTLIIIFTISLIFYLLSCFGVFDGLSEFVAHSLYNALGYTNKWSHSYGPPWFVNMVNNISSLGSRELVLIISIFMFFFIKIIRGEKAAKNFLFTVGVGIFIILSVKSITSKLDELTFKSLLVESLSNFPSGHTFIATVLYLAIARYLSTHRKYEPVNKFLFISAAIIIALVGISRFVGSGHTITEVIAGWSLGLCWYSFAQIFLASDHKTVFNK
ncbi:MAG TPA: phosphatase PAP2 family protein [Ignavibacteriaceae bacterium]|nr:phosphatase PAP2 family protein [Ignavibacteriaceae bacterium]